MSKGEWEKEFTGQREVIQRLFASEQASQVVDSFFKSEKKEAVFQLESVA